MTSIVACVEVGAYNTVKKTWCICILNCLRNFVEEDVRTRLLESAGFQSLVAFTSKGILRRVERCVKGACLDTPAPEHGPMIYVEVCC